MPDRQPRRSKSLYKPPPIWEVAEAVLREHGGPLTVAELARRVEARIGHKLHKAYSAVYTATVTNKPSNFKRPAPGVIALKIAAPPGAIGVSNDEPRHPLYDQSVQALVSLGHRTAEARELVARVLTPGSQWPDAQAVLREIFKMIKTDAEREQAPVEADRETCPHPYWKLESPNGPTATGVCARCGVTRSDFRNSFADAPFGHATPRRAAGGG